MKIAYSTCGCPGWDLQKIATTLSPLGYDGVELSGKIRSHLDLSRTPEGRLKIAQLFRDQGLSIVGISIEPPHLGDRKRQAETLATLREAIQFASDVGALNVRLSIGATPLGQSREEMTAAVIESILSISDEAEKAGVAVLLETFGALLDPALAAETLCRTNQKNFRAAYNAGTTFAHGHSIEKGLNALKKNLGIILLHDTLVIDGYEHPVLLGAGGFPLIELVNRLQAIPYDGFLVVNWDKVSHPELSEAEIAAPQHAMKLLNALRQAQRYPLEGSENGGLDKKSTATIRLRPLGIQGTDKKNPPDESTQIFVLEPEEDLVASGEHQIVHLHQPGVKLSDKKWIGYSLALFNVPAEKSLAAARLLVEHRGLSMAEATELVKRPIVSVLRDVGSERIYPVKAECERLDLPFRITHPHEV